MEPRIYLQHPDKRMLLTLHKQVSTVADELARRAASRQMQTYPTCIWRLCWGWPRLSFAEIFGVGKTTLCPKNGTTLSRYNSDRHESIW